MPTAAKLMAAFCLASLAFVVSQMIMPLMPERSEFGYFVPINMAVGALVGWVIMAPRSGHGMGAGITNGLTGAFMLVLWGLATHAVIRMLDLSMQRRYDGMGDSADWDCLDRRGHYQRYRDQLCRKKMALTP